MLEYTTPTALYYGDSNVKIGQPFSITCIIPINIPIHWLKDDEPITRHNLRHGRDEHSYILTESAIEGEKHKIEAHIMVRHALKVHEGKYRCNDMHNNYHLLRVYTPLQEPKPLTRSPFIIWSGDNNQEKKDWPPYEPTESISVYETIKDLTPNSADIFERNSEIRPPDLQSTKSVAIVTATTRTHKQLSHKHHHPTEEQFEREKSKYIYSNSSDNINGNQYTTSGNHQQHQQHHHNNKNNEHMDIVNLDYVQPTIGTTQHNHHQHHHYQDHHSSSTVPWHLHHQLTTTTTSSNNYSPMPQYPPPRTTATMTTMIPYYSSTQHRQQQQQQQQTNQLIPTAPPPAFVVTHQNTPKVYHDHSQQIKSNQIMSTISTNAAILQPPNGNTMQPYITETGESLVLISKKEKPCFFF